MDIYVLDSNFKAVKIINNYKSIIWAKRYINNGDCELVCPIDGIKNNNYTTGLPVTTNSSYVDVRDYTELVVANETIPRTGQSPAHLILYPYINGTQQDYIDISDQLDNGTPIDISAYDGIKFRINYSSGTYTFNYKLKSCGVLDVLKPGYYITRSDDDMICRIKDLTVETDRENGDKVTVKAYDMKSLIDQRYLDYPFSIVDIRFATISDVVGLCVSNNIGFDDSGDIHPVKRGEGKLSIPYPSGWNVNSDIMDIKNEWSNVGELIRKYCTDKNVGIKASLKEVSGAQKIVLDLFEGDDKTSSVIFSEELGNLTSSKYTVEYNSYFNAFAVCSSDNDTEGKSRQRFLYPDDIGGYANDSLIDTSQEDAPVGFDRFEGTVSAEFSLNPDYETVRDTLYPGGTLTTNTAGTIGEYKVNNLKIECVTPSFKAWLQSHYSGTTSTEGNKEYFTISGSATVAKMTRAINTESWNVSLTTIAVYPTLWNAGNNALAENLPKETFEGTVIPNGQFKYKTDYDLGDVVRIENKYGISADARIVEVIESVDENGENLSLTFENKNIKMS